MTIPGSIRSLSGRPLVSLPRPLALICVLSHALSVSLTVFMLVRALSLARLLAPLPALPYVHVHRQQCASSCCNQHTLHSTARPQGRPPGCSAPLAFRAPCTLHPVPCALHPAFCAHARPCALPEVHNPKTTTYSTVGHCRGALHCSLTCLLLLLCLPLSWLTSGVCQAVAFMRGVFEGVSDL